MTTAVPLDLSPAAVNLFLTKTAGDDAFAAEVGVAAGLSPTAVATLLGDLASEVRRAMTLLARLPNSQGSRILEVGSGPGLVAAFLHQQGADVVGLDPVARGYEAFDAVRRVLTDHVSMPSILPIAACDLDPAEQGEFDVIFSVNVLEHMRPLHRNLDGLARVLAPGGRMIHTCPNYRVPYEPHYRMVLVPARPAWTRLVARRAGREPVWQSLNWITAADIRRFAGRHRLALSFAPGELAAAAARLREDPDFARRQRGPAVAALRALDAVGLGRLVERLPATWLTPMTFTARRPA